MDLDEIFQHNKDVSGMMNRISLLHEYGVVIHFGDDAKMRDFIIVDPDYITKVPHINTARDLNNTESALMTPGNRWNTQTRNGKEEN